MNDLRMPSLGADMQSGTLVRWHVRAGDTIHRGDIVAEVETEKGVFDVDSPEEGVVEELLVAEGTRVPVLSTLARLREQGPAALAPAVTAPAAREAQEPVPFTPVPRVSPLARRVAADLGVDLSAVHGSGDGGAITRADVERAAQAVAGPVEPQRDTKPAGPPAVPPAAPPAPPPTRDFAAAMRTAIGAAMVRSKREIPHYYVSQEFDVSRMVTWLQDTNAELPIAERILTVAVLLSAVARAVTAYPEFNGHVVDGAFHQFPDVHLGVAIALRGGGLIAPALHHADRFSPPALMPALLDLVGRTRGGGLRTSELTDGTLTVTALTEGHVRQLVGIIYPPQVAIVGFGAIADRPWAVNGLLGVRRTVIATVSADHRVSDGHRAALFLDHVQQLLLTPETL